MVVFVEAWSASWRHGLWGVGKAPWAGAAEAGGRELEGQGHPALSTQAGEVRVFWGPGTRQTRTVPRDGVLSRTRGRSSEVQGLFRAGHTSQHAPQHTRTHPHKSKSHTAQHLDFTQAQSHTLTQRRAALPPARAETRRQPPQPHDHKDRYRHAAIPLTRPHRSHTA